MGLGASAETRVPKFYTPYIISVTRPFCLVESHSQDAAANAGVLSVNLTTVLYYHLQLFIDIERETFCPFTVFRC